MNVKKEAALSYHSKFPAGKIEVNATKEVSTQRDLSLAYSPGVAEPCMEIFHDPDKVYDYTIKGNLVAVITNGTAVLGLGNIGPEASKPVMEGKAVLFKKYADINVFDIELNANSVDEFVAVVKALEPTFGGINLEDIKAPECFEIEKKLKEIVGIPLMHDDQHGTAIISSAALLNALEIAGKSIEKVKFLFLGAGAAAVSCARMYVTIGAKVENIMMFDKDGLIHQGRSDLNPYNSMFAQNHSVLPTLLEGFSGIDVFVGLSAGNIVKPEMLSKMATNPIIFALANPDPEITYELATQARPDAIVATGRSDYPNQVNNVLGFPYIFRGALDVRASHINEAMKVAAAKALANLAKEPVPDIVNKAYSEKNITFGKDYLIPKPMDPRLIIEVSAAVAEAAIQSGIAKKPFASVKEYKEKLQDRMSSSESIIRNVIQKAKKDPKKVVFAEADNYKVLKSVEIILDEGIAVPVLLGNKAKIDLIIQENHLDIKGIEIIDPMEESEKREEYGTIFFEKRKRRGHSLYDCQKLMRERNYFGSMMVQLGEADAFISGLTKTYPSTLKPALQTIGKEQNTNLVAGMYLIKTKKGPFFFADTTVNKKPDVEGLIDITRLVMNALKYFNVEPRIAMLSYSNFGSNIDPDTQVIIDATKALQEKYPDVIIDGDIQANMALRPDLLKENYPFTRLSEKGANTFIFPDLFSGNIAYKLMQEMGNAEAVGPILLGMNKPVHVLQLGSSVREIVNMVAIAVVDAQNRAEL